MKKEKINWTYRLIHRGGWRNVAVVAVAALLLELVSALQYYYSRQMLESEMEQRVLMDLGVKERDLRATLNSAEQTLKEHIWDVRKSLETPDSITNTLSHVIKVNDKVVGGFLAFTPYYYKEKGRLYEPYVYEENGKIMTEQLGELEGHNYLEHPGFIRIMKQHEPFWSDPYEYKSTSGVQSLTTYTYPLLDKNNRLIAAYGLDVSLSWLGDTLNAHHHKTSSFELFLTPKGQLVGGPSEKIVSKKRRDQVVVLINDSTVDHLLADADNVRYIEFYDDEKEDKAYIYYLQMHHDPFWTVALVCYDSEVYGGLDKIRKYSMLLMLAGFLLLGFIIHRMIRNIITLNQKDMEQKRIADELRIASNIQQSMLPKDFPPFPDRTDIDVYGQLLPAREVGGDLFDFFIRNEKLFFCIGDVSGKGVPSAMIMAQAQSLFRVASTKESNAAHIMQTLNEILCLRNKSNMFITFFIGVLDLPTGRLSYCNAGHDKPVIVGKGQLDANPHLPLGVFDDVSFSQQEMMLEPGTMLFLYTDGLTEAMNVRREQFGLKRVQETVVENDSCEALVTHVTKAVHDFAEGAEQSDDLTLLAIRYQNKGA